MQTKPCASDRLLKCLNKSCNNGKFFHLTCLKYKRMPNNSQTTWICPGCRKSSNITKSSKNKDDITFVKVVHNPPEKYKIIEHLSQKQFEIIMSPTGWLDCTIVHDAQTLLSNINQTIKGFKDQHLALVNSLTSLWVTSSRFCMSITITGCALVQLIVNRGMSIY